jgi:hypothetical protein
VTAPTSAGAGTSRGRWHPLARIAAVAVVMALLGFVSFKVLSQRKAPSGAREASPIGPPPSPGMAEVTLTCYPRVLGTRAGLFSVGLRTDASLGAAGSDNIPLDSEILRERVARVTQEAGGPVPVRVELALPPISGAQTGATGAGSGLPSAAAEDGDSLIEWAAKVGRVLRAVKEGGGIPYVAVDIPALRPSTFSRLDLSGESSEQVRQGRIEAVRRWLAAASPGSSSEPAGEPAFRAGALAEFLVGADGPYARLRGESGLPEEPFDVRAVEIRVSLEDPGTLRESSQGQLLGKLATEVASAFKAHATNSKIAVFVGLGGVSLGDLATADRRARSAFEAFVGGAESLPDAVDGYAFDYAVPPLSSVEPSVGKEAVFRLEDAVLSVRQTLDALRGSRGKLLAIDLRSSAGASKGGTTWGSALSLSATLVALARLGVTYVTVDALRPGASEKTSDGGQAALPGFEFWQGRDPSRATPAFLSWAELSRHVGRDILASEITEGIPPAETETEGESGAGGTKGAESTGSGDRSGTTTAARAPTAADRQSGGQREPQTTETRDKTDTSSIRALCSVGENARFVVMANLSDRPAQLNVKFAGAGTPLASRKTVIVAPLDAEEIEISRSEFVGSTWFGETLPPYSITTWELARGSS